MTYSEKLKKPQWQKKRLEILQRDNFTCKLCGDTETQLHIHHLEYKDYNSDPWDIAYCLDCHNVVENLKDYEKTDIYKIIKIQHSDPSNTEIQIWVFCKKYDDNFIHRFHKKNGEYNHEFFLFEHEAIRIIEIFKEIESGI